MTALGRAEPARDLVAAGWHRVGALDDIPPLEGRSAAVDGRRVAIFRLPDGLAAIDAACPHAARPAVRRHRRRSRASPARCTAGASTSAPVGR